VNNKKTKKFLDKIIDEVDQKGIEYNSLTDSLQELREMVVKEDLPVLAKVIRLTYQHLEMFEDFYIPIPEDEPLDEEQEKENVKGKESILYLLNLIKHHDNKFNQEELREYIQYLEVFAEDDE
jgi:hypothetical protein